MDTEDPFHRSRRTTRSPATVTERERSPLTRRKQESGESRTTSVDSLPGSPLFAGVRFRDLETKIGELSVFATNHGKLHNQAKAYAWEIERLLNLAKEEILTKTSKDNKDTCSIGTQVTVEDIAGEMETSALEVKINQYLETGETAAALNMRWPESMFTCTKRSGRSLIKEAPRRILIAEEGNHADEVTWKNMAMQLCGLAKVSECGKLVVKRICESEEDESSSMRTVVALRLSQTYDTKADKFAALLKMAKEQAEWLDDNCTPCYMGNERERNESRKLLEIACRQLKMKLDVTTAKSGRKPNEKKRATTVVLKNAPEGRSYADILRKLQGSVDMAEHDIRLNGHRLTAKGELVLSVLEGSAGATAGFITAVSKQNLTTAEAGRRGHRKLIVKHLVDDKVREDIARVLDANPAMKNRYRLEEPVMGKMGSWS